MPKRKKAEVSSKRHAKALARRERKAGLYCKPGDPDFKDLSKQLQAQGLALKDVLGDGNCLFRALAQQLDGSHSNLRHRAVEHMRANSEDYAPFLDADTSFESYVDELSEDGTFAGNDAIVAVSRACNVNIVIHQLGAPRWEVQAPTHTKNTVHIAYLRGEHYCSVQPLHPANSLPPLEAQVQKQQHPTPPHKTVTTATAITEEKSDVDFVLEGTGCQDRALAEQCLRESGGEISLAIVELLQLTTLLEEGGGGAGDVQVEVEPVEPAEQHSHGRHEGPTTPEVMKQRHLSNRERKAAAKAARKQSALESRRHAKVKGKSQSAEDNNTDSLKATAI